MVQSDTVEGVQESETTLNLMCLDHTLQNVAHGQRLALAGKMVGDRQDSPQVVRWVPPFRGEEAIVEVEPPDLRANVERAADWVNLEVGSGDLCT